MAKQAKFTVEGGLFNANIDYSELQAYFENLSRDIDLMPFQFAEAMLERSATIDNITTGLWLGWFKQKSSIWTSMNTSMIRVEDQLIPYNQWKTMPISGAWGSQPMGMIYTGSSLLTLSRSGNWELKRTRRGVRLVTPKDISGAERNGFNPLTYWGPGGKGVPTRGWIPNMNEMPDISKKYLEATNQSVLKAFKQISKKARK